ncbi:MAG: DNA-3-methyladenine glycosylase 2 [Deltaproteobacteria bacterium]|nr:DNA-3-methyladenine glycosylase 2 [Deltaproteobacteria bacterium]MBW2419747.1 DNA-3-methyladenine glycosylase 2 [Deltaproteobacteria bacterium]
MSERLRFRLEPLRPYSLTLTAERYGRFADAVDRVEEGRYRRLLDLAGELVLLSVGQEGSPARATLQVELVGKGARRAAVRRAAESFVRGVLGAGCDVRPFYRDMRDDSVIGPAIRSARGLRVAGAASLFECLVTAILAQQLSLTFAYAIRSELARAYGRPRRIDGERWVAFPTPKRMASVDVETLRSFKLSNAKANAVSSVARACAAGELVEEELVRLDDEAVIERLSAYKGIGRWTAEMVLLRGLMRPDVFPAGDLGVIRYIAQGLLGRKERAREDEMRRFSERWRPHRSLALVYAYAELRRRESQQE